MPTGYTADVVDGKVTTFKAFAMRAMRAMGWCIDMRDEPMDAPIPKEFKVSAYSQDNLDDTVHALAQYRARTQKDSLYEYAEWVKKTEEYNAKSAERHRLETERLENMRDKVERWNPPESGEGMKEFMLNQIKISMPYDTEAYNTIVVPFEEWDANRGEYLENDLAYYTKKVAEETERNDKRNKMLNEVRDSIEAYGK